MKTYFVYILKCSDGSYYTGITNNLEKRFHEHQTGINNSCYTFRRRPVELVYSTMFYDVLQAISFEKQVKGWSRKKKEALIKENWNDLKKFSECQNNSHSKNYKNDMD